MKVLSFLARLIRRLFRVQANDTTYKSAPVALTPGIDVQPQTVEIPPANEVIEPVKRPARRAKKVSSAETGLTLAELLDGIDSTLESLTFGDGELNGFMDRSTVKALRTLGPTLLPFGLNSLLDWGNGVSRFVTNTSTFPSLVFIAMNDGERAIDGMCSPDFFFAVKEKKVPALVTRVDGVVYQTGFGWRDKKLNRTVWASFYVGINKATGEVKTTSYLTHSPVRTRTGTYCQRKWEVGSWFGGESQEESRNAVAHCVSVMFNAWSSIPDHWTVSASKRGKRFRAAIPRSRTASYFRNRDRSALTSGGKLRPIIHHVREHVRQLADGSESTVKEHIRGVRSFVWNGAQCDVIAPRFHTWYANKFDVAAADETSESADRLIPLSAVVGAIVEMESTQRAVPVSSLPRLSDEQQPEQLKEIARVAA